MRSRTFHELIRDSRVGSVLIAQFIATGLGALLIPLSWPIKWLLMPLINYIAIRSFHSEVVPLKESFFGWQFSVYLGGSGIGIGLMALAFAYLLAVWVYRPSKPKQTRIAAPMHPTPDS